MIRTEIGHFYITFENGCTLSIFNGYGSYSENHFNTEHWQEIIKKGDIYSEWISETCEIAVFDKSGRFKTKEILNSNDSVIGHVSVNELIKYINVVKNYKE